MSETQAETTSADTTSPAAEQVPVKFGDTGAVGSVPRAALDFWKARGYHELSAEEAAALKTDTTIGDPREGETGIVASSSTAFDPNNESADTVAKHLAGLDTATPQGQAEYDRIVKAEQDGQNRKTALPSS